MNTANAITVRRINAALRQRLVFRGKLMIQLQHLQGSDPARDSRSPDGRRLACRLAQGHQD